MQSLKTSRFDTYVKKLVCRFFNYYYNFIPPISFQNGTIAYGGKVGVVR